MKLYIKNMVCDRGIKVVREEFGNINVGLKHIELGEVDTESELNEAKISEVKQMLQTNGFELLDDKRATLVENIRTLIIEEVQYLKGHKPASLNFSDYISQKTGYEYSYLSNLFSSETGQTIEQYIIAHKIERVKELLVYDELNLTEIAYLMHYSSVAHLSTQFKKVTGLTPSHFKKLREKRRNMLEDL